MTTQLFYIDTLSALTISGLVVRSLSLTRGSGVVTKSQASAAAADLQVFDTGSTPLCFAYRVAAYSATTGTYNATHWGSESNATANFTAGTQNNSGVSGHIQGMNEYDNSGLWVATLCPGMASGVEYTTSAAARNMSLGGTAGSVADGSWIVIFPQHFQSGGTGSSGKTLTFSYNGTTSAANGDSFITLPDTVTAYTPPVFDPHASINQMQQLLAQ